MARLATDAGGRVAELRLSDNSLSGPIPDLSVLAALFRLDLTGNLLCLPVGTSLSGPNESVTAHLQDLNLPPCPDS